MKQTIQLEGNRKAVVEIPYSKFTSTSNAYQRATQDSNCCDSKVVLVGCGGCSSKSRQSNLEINAILADLEASYDKDVKELKSKIQSLEGERDKNKQSHFEEITKLRFDLNQKILEKQSAVQLLRIQCKRKDSQIADLLNEKEMLIKSKISEFRQSEYIDRIHELQGIIKVKEFQINDLTIRLQRSNQERIKLEEARVLDQGHWERQIANLRSNISELQIKYAKEIEERNISFSSKSEEYAKKIREYQILLEQGNHQSKTIRKQMETQSNDLSKQIELLNHLKRNLEESLKSEQQKVVKLQADQISICQDLRQLREEAIIYMDKLQKNEETILVLDKQKSDLLLELQARIVQISQLKQDINNKQKVYEVKIQRVIDGQSQIEELRNVVAELEMQLKRFSSDKDILSEELKKREYANDQLRGVIAKLEAQIAGLKVYIEKREGSFKWAVEREIEKDIVVTDSKNQYYKVSQVKQYSRDKNSSRNYKMAFDRISSGIHQHLAGNFAEQIILTNENQLNQATFVQPNQTPYNQPNPTFE